MQFQHPTFLLIGLGLLIVTALFTYIIPRDAKRTATLKFSNASFLQTNNVVYKYLAKVPSLLKFCCIALIIVALAGPYQTNENEKVFSEGIDIAIALDISASMDEEDLSPNRLLKARDSITQFISSRRNDRIALVLFGKDAYLQCPLTLDHDMLLYFLRLQGMDKEVRESTAIGTAISTAIISLKNSSTTTSIEKKPQSKIIILVTDGDNTSGEIDPITAARLAESYGIKVYSIGIGKKKNQLSRNNKNLFSNPSPPFDVQFNEAMLQEISEITGGKYFNVQNNAQMEATYREIDSLEKYEIAVDSLLLTKKTHQKFIVWAFLLFTIELLLRFSFLRIFPGTSIRT